MRRSLPAVMVPALRLTFFQAKTAAALQGAAHFPKKTERNFVPR